ncbi:MAG: glycosyltransferase [Rhodobacterales bacterium]|nr:glycosyltransferase [Rhodobacterales bacterium]MDX5414048.1 glycosyltransferase [Rhodobacterales bacterium]
MSRGLISVFFYINLAIVTAILGYKVYLYASAPDANALLLDQIERIEARSATAERVSFVVVGEANNSIGLFEREIIPRVNASDADFLVSSGNIVSGGGEDKYRALLGTLSRLRKPYLLTFGENEYTEFGSGRFYQRFGPHFYDVDLRSVRLIFLDSTGRTPTDWQERWLRDELEADRTRPVIVFLGNPLVDPVPQTLFAPDRGAWSAPPDRDRLLALLSDLGVDMAISAGAATYSDRRVGGVRHILTGGAGGFVLNDDTSFYHYLESAVGPEGIAVDVARLGTAPTALARRVEGFWFFIYSLFYVGIWNFLLIFSGFMILGVYLFNRLFRSREYYPSYDVPPPVDLGRPMRIAMFTNTYLPFIGGVPISIERLKRGLEQQGHAVRIICPSYGGAEADPTILRVPVLLRLGAMFTMANPFPRGISREVAAFAPDVIHVHHPYWLGGLGLRLARRLKVPTVFSYHTRLDQFGHAVPFISILFRNVLSHWIIRRFANQCHQIIVPTPVTRDYIRLIGVTRPVHVLPTGIDLDRYDIHDAPRQEALAARLNPDRRQLLITVARLSPEKNLPFIIRAMAQLKRLKVPPFRLVILGEGEEHARLEQLVRDLGLSEDVTLLGAVPYEEVPGYLAVADVFVYASSSETQGMVILEAMAAGLPVVAVNSSGIDAFVVHEQTGLVTTENINLWTEALQQLLQDECRRNAMESAARKVAARHSTQAFAEGVAGAYRAALGTCVG